MSKRRIDLLDLWRASAVVCMVIYHYLYDYAMAGHLTWAQIYSPPISILQIFSSYSFIVIAGISSRLSRSNVKRGGLVLLCAMGLSAVAYFAGVPIWFGILHFLGCCMILYGLLGKYIECLPQRCAPFVFLALFLVMKYVTAVAPAVRTRLLVPIGFPYPGFYSADYYPLLPWMFLFLFGTWLGGVFRERDDTEWLYTPVPAALTWPGRHSLVIYLAHQPLFYALTYAFAALLNAFSGGG